MLNRSASLAMSTSVLKALPGKLDIKRHSPSILYLPSQYDNILTVKTRTTTANGCPIVVALIWSESFVLGLFVVMFLVSNQAGQSSSRG